MTRMRAYHRFDVLYRVLVTRICLKCGLGLIIKLMYYMGYHCHCHSEMEIF